MRNKLLLTLLLWGIGSHALAGEWRSWPVVGEATFRWFMLTIYHSQLRTPNGQYLVDEHNVTAQPLALDIEYRKNIKAKALLDATAKQWSKQGIDARLQRGWLSHLAGIFPDIRVGEHIIYVTDGLTGEFYWQREQELRYIGKVTDIQLSSAFLGIWLGKNTRYPKLRQQLTGVTP